MAGEVDPEIPRPDPQTPAERMAAKYGVTVAQLEAAKAKVPEFRAWARGHAAQVKADAFATLDRADARFMTRPVRGTSVERAIGKGRGGKLGGEWDWMEGLKEGEKSRLRRGFETGGGYEPDNIAERLRQAGLVYEDISDGEVIESVWLPLNRTVEAAGALARGKLPSELAYTSLDVDTLIGAVADEGYSVTALFDPDPLEAAGHLAQRWSEQAYTEARQALAGGSLNPVYGPAPWRMTFDSFAEEVTDLEYDIANGTGDAALARARLSELIPHYLDDPGKSLSELYDDIIETAGLANESVAEWVEVY